jgi:PilZ domain
MGEEMGGERRASERFPMDFKVSVHDIGESGQVFLEGSVLHDVSGVGVSFLSKAPELYHAGQRLHISIILPGTDTLEARLEGDATVVRVDRIPKTAEVYIGVSMDDPLDFVSGIHLASSPDDSGHSS